MINDQNIDRWYDHNIDITNRTLFMGSISSTPDDESGVDNFMAESIIKGLHTLDTINNKPITIIMNNTGGDWYHGMAIYDAIKNTKSHTTIKVFGHAMSMGSIILQSPNNRIMLPNSRLMLHYGQNSNQGHPKLLERWSEESKKLNHTMEQIYLEKIVSKESNNIQQLFNSINNILSTINPSFKNHKLSPGKNINIRTKQYLSFISNLLDFDTYLTPEQTLSLGLIDSIQYPHNK
jgi:ATP-dependent protease ClpP protease subunit